jgi:hypothetical protein
MHLSEQERLLRAALEILGERCNFDPHFRHCKPDAIQEELNEDLDYRLFGA